MNLTILIFKCVYERGDYSLYSLTVYTSGLISPNYLCRIILILILILIIYYLGIHIRYPLSRIRVYD